MIIFPKRHLFNRPLEYSPFMCYPKRGKKPPLNDLHPPKTPLDPINVPDKESRNHRSVLPFKLHNALTK